MSDQKEFDEGAFWEDAEKVLEKPFNLEQETVSSRWGEMACLLISADKNTKPDPPEGCSNYTVTFFPKVEPRPDLCNFRKLVLKAQSGVQVFGIVNRQGYVWFSGLRWGAYSATIEDAEPGEIEEYFRHYPSETIRTREG